MCLTELCESMEYLLACGGRIRAGIKDDPPRRTKCRGEVVSLGGGGLLNHADL